MSVRTANSDFHFELPRLSYIDASWEGLNHQAPAETSGTSRKTGLAAWLAHQVEAFRTWRHAVRATSELATMSDRQLMDIGICRSDLRRVFETEFNQDLRERAGVSRCAKP
jgi:uncharacterized protein YjiS (DUF1127 family)